MSVNFFAAQLGDVPGRDRVDSDLRSQVNKENENRRIVLQKEFGVLKVHFPELTEWPNEWMIYKNCSQRAIKFHHMSHFYYSSYSFSPRIQRMNLPNRLINGSSEGEQKKFETAI